jgi:hypothetical protein
MTEREKNTAQPQPWMGSPPWEEYEHPAWVGQPAATPAATLFPECEHYEFEPKPEPFWVEWLT